MEDANAFLCPELEKKTHVLGSVRKKEKEHILWLSVGFSMFSYTTNKPDGSPRKKKNWVLSFSIPKSVGKKCPSTKFSFWLDEELSFGFVSKNK